MAADNDSHYLQSPKRSPTRAEVTNGVKQGRFYAKEVRLLDGTTVVKIVSSQGTFTPDLYNEFLDEYEKHGMIRKAAAAIGVSSSAVRRVIARNTEFAEACVECEETYRDKMVQHIQNLAFNGSIKQTFDRTGKLLTEEIVYPIPLIQMEARRVEAGYRDKREVEMKVSGGVLIAPAEVKSIDEWESRYSDGDTIEGEATEIKDHEDQEE